MMLLHKVLWAFGFLSTAFTSAPKKFEIGNFGVCEHVVSKSMLNESASPPVHYKMNVSIFECCEGFLTFGFRCIPECQKVCVNSHCIGKNKCQCHSGYYAVDDFRCLPKCDVECHSTMACLAPNKCSCKPEHKRVNDSHCEPICSFQLLGDDNFDCINAKCTSPNVCECLEGFQKVSEFQCEPICDSSCDMHHCVAPGVCECKEFFEKNSDGICEPICDPPCINSQCVGPNVCKCDKNYDKYLKSHECLEKQLIKDRQSCEKSCQHGTCNDDGTCVCEIEYEMYNDKCSKKCDNECKGGKCLENQCICPENYKLSENSTECLPICAFEDGHDCISGVCIAPQICECFEGYRFLDERNCTCVPKCQPQCINSICTESGCQCHEDYDTKISDYECIKNCSEGFKWVHDECMEDIEFDSDDFHGLMIFDDETTTETTITPFEESSENDDESTADDNDDDEDGSGQESTDEIYETTERETIMVQTPLQQLIPLKLCIILLSIIFILIISILSTFCFLYRRVNPKNIYYVNQQEKTSNCVYFTRQNDPTLKSSDVECSL